MSADINLSGLQNPVHPMSFVRLSRWHNGMIEVETCDAEIGVGLISTVRWVGSSKGYAQLVVQLFQAKGYSFVSNAGVLQ